VKSNRRSSFVEITAQHDGQTDRQSGPHLLQHLTVLTHGSNYY